MRHEALRREIAMSVQHALLSDPTPRPEERRWKWQECSRGDEGAVYYGGNCRRKVYTESCAEATARIAVEHADALLKALGITSD